MSKEISRGDPPGGRILVVDDEDATARALTRHLEGEGHRTRVAATGEEAIRLIGTERFDFILLDIGLPGMTGFEAIEEIAQRTDAPVVLMSGHADEEARRDALLLGAKDLLAKPFDFAEVDRIVPKWLAPLSRGGPLSPAGEGTMCVSPPPRGGTRG
ncbi:MAG: response regulator [Elusimicrobiota bacterium]